MMKVTIRYKSREEESFDAYDGPFTHGDRPGPEGAVGARFFYYVTPGPVLVDKEGVGVAWPGGRRFFNLDSVESWDSVDMVPKENPLETAPGK